ncbi:MAG: glycoside hydrolase family 57 protein [Thiolinea sp.]
MIEPLTPFQTLVEVSGAIGFAKHQQPLRVNPLYLSEQYFIDLLTWYHLAWLGQSLRQDTTVQRLMAKGEGYTLADRHELLGIMQNCMAGLLPRYRALAERGQVELSMTPYMHPIVPLLHDFGAMRCAQPDAPAPEAASYPGGYERARWHMEQGLAVFEHHFGRCPRGVWLSEGAVSETALALLDEFDLQWTASGEGVWRNSCERSGFQGEVIESKRDLFLAHQLEGQSVQLFFRDDGLSDLIGFKYSGWDPEQAASDFVLHLNNIADFLGETADQRVVSIILDGENAWEYYPDNGYRFLDALYRELEQAGRLRMRHFSEVSSMLAAKPLPVLCAGSWVYGSLSTWIGEPDKNRAWDYLVAAKQAYDENIGNLDTEMQAQAERQLGICEGSDWFWWFGGYNPAASVSDFEQLFRQQLTRLYQLLGAAAPAYLAQPLSAGGGPQAENAGTMRRNT